MSWSFNAIGKPKAVLEKARLELTESAYKCPEPEESARKQVYEILKLLLPSYPSTAAVKIEASGSQYTPDLKVSENINQLKLDIQPLYGFIE